MTKVPFLGKLFNFYELAGNSDRGLHCVQGCKKIIDLDLKDRDHLIDLDLLCDLDHYR